MEIHIPIPVKVVRQHAIHLFDEKIESKLHMYECTVAIKQMYELQMAY